MEEVKGEEVELNQDKQQFLRKVKQLKTEHGYLQEEIERHRKNEEILNKLHMSGLIDDKGNPVMRKWIGISLRDWIWGVWIRLDHGIVEAMPWERQRGSLIHGQSIVARVGAKG